MSISPESFVYFEGGAARLLTSPRRVVVAHALEQVQPALREVEEAVARGHTAAGYVAYEAAPAFDAAMATHPPGGPPLLWFGLYAEESPFTLPQPASPDLAWSAGVGEVAYEEAVAQARAYIAAGDTYQVNLTFPLRSPWQGDPLACFAALHEAQPSPFAAFIHLGRWQVLSHSPELFFSLDGDRIVTRPMKGTRPRGRYPAEDAAMARELVESAKERAENVMIADLLRNDLGRIAEVGSVHAPSLFTAERYPTVWQLTSTIEARTCASVPEIFSALFPCGSVTGAPKLRTMEIIRELEHGPRGVYCGAIGLWRPGRRARFSVAIRTLTVDAGQGTAEFHTGSGITWDSAATSEYRECMQKTCFLTMPRDSFDLLETMRLDHGGIALLERHLARMRESAAYFGWDFPEPHIREAIAALQGPARVRLMLGRDGHFRVETQPLPESRPMRVALHDVPVDSRDRMLFHKTTRRAMYDAALAAHPDTDDVLLFNERGELTESCRANVVVRIGGVDCTPPLDCGLLPGCMRAELLARGEIQERIITRADLEQAEALWVVNALRGRSAAHWKALPAP